jgi:hypothetical protein
MAGYVNRGINAAALTRTQWLNIVATSVIAFAGGGKASATRITSANARITTVATAADSVLVPSPRSGDVMLLRNDGANAAQVFGAGTSTINAAATGTGASLAAGKIALLQSFADGAWLMTVLN